MRKLYLTTLKLNAVIILLLVSLVGGFARPILDAWLGPAFATGSGAILVVLALGYGLTALVGVSGHLTDAAGHPGWTATYVSAGAVLNIVLSLILVPRVGAIGAAYALLIQNGLGGVAFMLVVHWRILRLSIGDLVSQLIRPLGAAFVVTAVAVLLSPHLHGAAEVLIALVAGAGLYLGLTWVLGVWDERERRLAWETISTAVPLSRRK
jgi:O-antigen/teichoic acid export membrane protein